MEHPDVLQLENRLNRVWEGRDIEAEREAVKRERDIDEDTPPQIFLCRKCNKDYSPKRIVKVEQQDWNTNGVFRFWRSKHCGVWNVRLITDKLRDSFFIKSPSVIRDRRINRLDLLQPQETGFNMLYGRKNV